MAAAAGSGSGGAPPKVAYATVTSGDAAAIRRARGAHRVYFHDAALRAKVLAWLPEWKPVDAAAPVAWEMLAQLFLPHVVLERDRIAERWRSQRWDSLVANGPAWHDRFPELEFPGIGADVFATKSQTVDYFIEYANRYNAPIEEGVAVSKVVRNSCLLYTSPSPRDATLSRMPSSA